MDDEIREMVSYLEANPDRLLFFDRFRGSRLAYIPHYFPESPQLHQLAFKVLYEIGKLSIPAAVALAMHTYLVCSIASYPLKRSFILNRKRQWLIQEMAKKQWLIATMGGVRTFKSDKNIGLRAQQTRTGYIINGRAEFMSLADVADVALLSAMTDQGNHAIFLVSLKNNPNFVLEKTSFHELMSYSGTMSVRIDGLTVHDKDTFVVENKSRVDDFFAFQRAWFQSLISAPYLGAASMALNTVAEIGASKTTRSGVTLDNIDGLHVSLGKLVMEHKSSLLLCERTGKFLADYCEDKDRCRLYEIFEASALAKYFGTHVAEKCVASLKSIIGTEAFRNPRLENITHLIQYGIVHPASDFDLERYFGRKFIGKPYPLF